jgi:MFS transporter, PAT family, beta-lactamase induction signal transducer AmpG
MASVKSVSAGKRPWFWVPTTFYMEGFPGVMIMFVLGIMYKNFGVSNAKITLYTGMLVMPWVIKPLWASLIDVFMTKRWWIYMMEIIVGCLFLVMAFVVKTPNYFLLSIAVAWIIAFLSSSHDIATDGFYLMELDQSQQSFFVGVQSASYNIGKICATGLIVMLCGFIYDGTNNYFTAWTFGLTVVGGICIALGLYHKIILPKDEKKEHKNLKQAVHEFCEVYVDFFKLKGLIMAFLFLFFYKLSESMISTILPLFLLDPVSRGGLGLTNAFTGLAYGTVSPLAIILGGFLGGYAIYRKGFRYWIWWMLLAVNSPNAVYIILARFHIQSHAVILSCIAFEQFCFSFGYSAYLIFIYYMVKDSKFKTAHYAFFAGIMLLGIMIPKMISGWLQELMGYENFFIFIMFMLIPAAIVVKFLKMNPAQYGRRKET